MKNLTMRALKTKRDFSKEKELQGKLLDLLNKYRDTPMLVIQNLEIYQTEVKKKEDVVLLTLPDEKSSFIIQRCVFKGGKKEGS